MTNLELLFCIALLATSAYLSASEIALFSLSSFQLRALKENFKSVHRQIKSLLSDPSGLLISILVLNEMVNIGLSAVITKVVARESLAEHLRGWGIGLQLVPEWMLETLLGLAFTTPLVLFVGEVTPKTIAAKANQPVASLTATPLTFIYRFMMPIRVAVKWLVRLMTQWNARAADAFKGESHEKGSGRILKEADFMLLLEEGHREGTIQEEELELIRNVFELDDTTVSQIYTSLKQVKTLPANTQVKQALLGLRSQRYSRIPVMGPDRRSVVGILYSKDLLAAKFKPDMQNLNVTELMRKPFYVSPSMRLNALFRKFKENKVHLAVVQGHHGDSLGIITLSDVLDTLFEEYQPDEKFGFPSPLRRDGA